MMTTSQAMRTADRHDAALAKAVEYRRVACLAASHGKHTLANYWTARARKCDSIVRRCVSRFSADPRARRFYNLP
ncbi:hypothetical protein ACU4GI_32635 [Cupriavidus basilensis]